MTEFSIGVDLGGTNMRAAAIGKEGELLDKIAGKTNLSEGRDAVIDDMVNSIQELRQRIEGRFAGVGIGVPGFILLKEGFIVGSNNLVALENFPIRDEIERRLGAPVILENDANAAAMGEKWIGAGRDVNNLILLTLGTGIGGGIVYHGRVMHGAVGMAGELGHMTIVPNGLPCGCGNQGCLEKHASATAVAAMAIVHGLGPITAEEVHQLAEKGNERALMIFEHMGQSLGIAIANLVNIFNFPLYLLSGGPLPAWDFFAPAMMAEVKKRSFTFRKTETKIAKAELGGKAGLFGAAYLPFLAQSLARR
jgi:glucokinase